MDTKYFSCILCEKLPIFYHNKLPNVIIPNEYENKYSVSTKPKNILSYIWNYYFICVLDNDHP
jgi:hypothetical protein